MLIVCGDHFEWLSISKRWLVRKKKKNSADEFLVKKKNPLVLPPEFEKLPQPKNLNSKKQIEKEEDINLESVFGKESNTKNTTSKNKKINTSLEKSIIEKIKDN